MEATSRSSPVSAKARVYTSTARSCAKRSACRCRVANAERFAGNPRALQQFTFGRWQLIEPGGERAAEIDRQVTCRDGSRASELDDEERIALSTLDPAPIRCSGTSRERSRIHLVKLLELEQDPVRAGPQRGAIGELGPRGP